MPRDRGSETALGISTQVSSGSFSNMVCSPDWPEVSRPTERRHDEERRELRHRVDRQREDQRQGDPAPRAGVAGDHHVHRSEHHHQARVDEREKSGVRRAAQELDPRRDEPGVRESRVDDATGQRLGEQGHEFGTVTGRKRRCGWFDAVLVRQSAAVSGITGIALTKIDVLDGFDRVKICTGYRIGDREYDYLPPHSADQARATPVYEEMPGWEGTTAGARSWADLPAQAIKYVRRIEELIRCPVALVSTSPQRDDTILVRDPFAS